MQDLIKGGGLGKPAQEVAFPSTCFALSLFSRVDKSTCPLLTFSSDYLLSLPSQDSPAHFLFLSLPPSLALLFRFYYLELLGCLTLLIQASGLRAHILMYLRRAFASRRVFLYFYSGCK